MMGEQVDLDTQITAKKAEGTVVDSKVVEQTALKEKYENTNDTSSPQYFFNKIRDELRKDGGWAESYAKRPANNNIFYFFKCFTCLCTLW